MVGLSMNGPARDRVLRLMAEKDRIESEIRQQTAILETNNIGMHEPLVDHQGYPRNDIDVYKVRHARHQILCLQNDHKALMKKIEQGLAEVHADILPTQGPQSRANITSSHASLIINENHNNSADIEDFKQNGQGFATITFVHNGSPADLAGLCSEDEVLQFGSVNAENFSDITQVHEVVAHSIGQNIRVLVRRNNTILNLNVMPKPWGQPGLLGCQIVRRSN